MAISKNNTTFNSEKDMNTIDCIKTRRSVRKFKDEQIKDDELIQVLEAGTWSPTSMGASIPISLQCKTRHSSNG